MGVATLEGFWPAGPGAGVAIVLLIGCMLVAPAVMAFLSRPLMRDVDQLSRENARLRELYGRARQDALLDGLTGLGNHRGFQEELVRQLEHAERTGSALALLLVDVDDLKRVNDERGHASGDRAPDRGRRDRSRHPCTATIARSGSVVTSSRSCSRVPISTAA